MEFRYKKLMEENDLALNQIPEDAKTGIDEINKVLRGITMRERAGKKVLPGTLKKLATMDKWVTYEILDFLDDTDKNDDNIPFAAKDVLKDLDKDNTPPTPPIPPIALQPVDELGLKIDQELDNFFQSGKTLFTIDEIRSSARITYKEIWDNYEEGEENGIITSKYSLLEGDDKTFNLKLK
jgi:hypothetical protein